MSLSPSPVASDGPVNRNASPVQHAHTSSLGTIAEVLSSTDLCALADIIDCGAPISGQYAKNGLWDDDSDEDNCEALPNKEKERRESFLGDASRNWKQRLSSASIRSSRRSRAGTLPASMSPTTASPTDGSWPWHRKLSFSANHSHTIAPLLSPPISSLDGQLHIAPLPSPSFAHTTLTSPVSSTPVATSSSPPTSPLDTILSIPAPEPAMKSNLVFKAPTKGDMAIVLPSSAPASEPATAINLKPSKSHPRLRSMGVGQKTKAPAPLKLPKKVEKKISVLESPLLSPGLPSRSPLTQVITNTLSSEHVHVLAEKTPSAVNPKVERRNQGERPKSVWKRGVERLWRSKSASGLHDSFHRRPTDNDAPPVPTLPPMYGLGTTGTTGAVDCKGRRDLSLGVVSARESMVAPINREEPIFLQLDKKYPSYPARIPAGASPIMTDDETFESDPFASVVDYAAASSRASRTVVRPAIPNFSNHNAQLDMAGSGPIKAGLMPRLRKSKSMAMSSRPISIVGLFTDRKRSVLSGPKPSLGATEHNRNNQDELFRAPSALGDDTGTPMPLFYDMFDLADEERPMSSTIAPNGIKESTSLGFVDHHSRPPSSTDMGGMFPVSAQPFPTGSTELLLSSGTSTTTSAAGHSIVTPPLSVVSYVTSHVTQENVTTSPAADADAATPHPFPSLNSKHGSIHTPSSLIVDPSSSPTLSSTPPFPLECAFFQNLCDQLGVLPDQAEKWLEQLPERQQVSPTPEPVTDDPARDDQSACDPSPLSTPRASWESARSFPAFGYFVLSPPSTTAELTTAYNPSVDYTGNVSVDGLDMDSSSMSNFAAGDREGFRAGMGPSVQGNPVTLRRAATTRDHVDSNTAESWRTLHSALRGDSSRNSSCERSRRPAAAEGGWSMDSDSSDELDNDDDVPLSQLHPAAGAAQQQKLVAAVRRREARRAERERSLRHSKSQLLDRERMATRDRDIKRAVSLRDPKRSRRPAFPEWNGEGGVPADMLAGRLEGVVVSSSPPSQQSRSAGVSRVPTISGPQGAPLFSRSARVNREDPSPATPATPSYGTAMSRTPTVGANSIHSTHSATSGSHHTDQQQLQRDLGRGVPFSQSTSRATLNSNSSGPSPTASVVRSNTSKSRRRALSNAREQPRSPADAHAPPVPRRGMHVRCVIATSVDERPIPLEIFPESTARDVLNRARECANLVDGSNGPTSGWVVFEIFAEMGLERQLREYEVIAHVVRGWDAQAHRNCLEIRESHHANQTHAQSVSDTAPFVGGWVQLETKRGKWNKRWLETRGGHIFISKNEKGKDEMQVNTQFSDTYTPTQGYPGPQRHVFALKRRRSPYTRNALTFPVEPLASFEKPAEHIHFISTDDATGFKLSTAAYMSRSFTLVSAQKSAQVSHTPHSLNRASSLKRSVSHSRPHGQDRQDHTSHFNHGGTRHLSLQQPLVDLKPNTGPSRHSGNAPLVGLNSNAGFTGKGLLGNM